MMSLLKKITILIAVTVGISLVSKIVAILFLFIGALVLALMASTGNVKSPEEEKIPDNRINQLRNDVRSTMEKNQKNKK